MASQLHRHRRHPSLSQELCSLESSRLKVCQLALRSKSMSDISPSQEVKAPPTPPSLPQTFVSPRGTRPICLQTSSNVTADSPAVECLICLEPIVAGTSESIDDVGYQCRHEHTTCRSCLSRCLDMRLHNKDPFENPYGCPGHCEDGFDEQHLAALGWNSYIEQLKPLKLAFENPRQTPCPKCQTMVGCRDPTQPRVRCPSCKTRFCYHHGLEHADGACPIPRESAYRRLRNWIWLKKNTRPCSQCHERIQKNGGCNHMTCRCGHEICWCCGRDYMKNGRRGHGQELFPSPSELKYQCNGWKQWSMRIGASVVIVPAATCWIAGRYVALPIAYGTVYSLGYPVRLAQRAWTRSSRRRERAQATLDSATRVCDSMHDYHNIPAHQQCLTCSRRSACWHSDVNDIGMCTNCRHFGYAERDGCIAHYYGSGQTCHFCHRDRPTSAAREVVEEPASAVPSDADSLHASEVSYETMMPQTSGVATPCNAVHSRSSSSKTSYSRSSSVGSIDLALLTQALGRPETDQLPQTDLSATFQCSTADRTNQV
eukprot:m.124812 g.124812  ORF g.124812 m.124812 type:complete len:542 (+) comp15722_c0_seq1:82-1707(+)